MKFGFVLLFWLLCAPLFSQNCDQVAIPPVRYFEETDTGTKEVHTYLVPCSESKTLSVQYPPNAWTGYIDPDPSSPAGIMMILLQQDPEKPVFTIAEFENLIYRDANGKPLYYSDPNASISIQELTNQWNVSNEFVLVPIMVSNINGTDTNSWFEEDCIRVFSEYGLKLISNPEIVYDFIHFNEISFIRWPSDTSITDYFEFTFTDQESGDSIPYTMTDNRSFQLHFPKSRGIFNFKMTWKDKDCQTLVLGVNWTFPEVRIMGDTVPGYKNIEKCIPVRAYNFESVTNFEINVSWHRDSIGFTNIKNIHPDLAPHVTTGSVADSGGKQVLQLKLPEGRDTITLPDNTVLFEWCGRPLVEAGHTAQVHFSGPIHDDTKFSIYGFETESATYPGMIYVQKDRELNYDLTQLCTTRDGKHRMVLDVNDAKAFPYIYSFNSELVMDSIVDSVPVLIPDVPPGQYEFTVKDSFGFEITETVVVQEYVPPGFDLVIDSDRVVHPTCLSPFGGQMAVNLTPRGQNYKLSLLNDDAVFSHDSVTGLVAGQYHIEAEDEMGCIDTLHYTLQNPREIHITWNVDDLVICPGDDQAYLVIEDQHSDADTSIQFQLDGGEVHRLGDTIPISKPGSYILQLWNADGCTLDTTVILRASPGQLTVWDTTSIQISLGDTLDYMTTDHPGLNNLTWSYNNILIGERNDIHFIPDESGVFTFKAEIYNRCEYTDTLNVHVIQPNQKLPDFAFPNAFSPNGDGNNDYYRITPSRNIRQVISMKVYDRFGNYVYSESNNEEPDGQQKGWNGRHAGVEAPPGIYAIQAKLILYDGREETVGFDVMLIR